MAQKATVRAPPARVDSHHHRQELCRDTRSAATRANLTLARDGSEPMEGALTFFPVPDEASRPDPTSVPPGSTIWVESLAQLQYTDGSEWRGLGAQGGLTFVSPFDPTVTGGGVSPFLRDGDGRAPGSFFVASVAGQYDTATGTTGTGTIWGQGDWCVKTQAGPYTKLTMGEAVQSLFGDSGPNTRQPVVQIQGKNGLVTASDDSSVAVDSAALLARSGVRAMTGPLGLMGYTLAPDNRPDPATVPGHMIYLLGTRIVQYSDGASWLTLYPERTDVLTRVRKTAPQSMTNQWQVVTFDNLLQDQAGLWVGPDRIQVPVDNPRRIRRLDFHCQIDFYHDHGDTIPLYLTMTMNGEHPDTIIDADEMSYERTQLMGEEGKGSDDVRHGLDSGPIPVSGGDYMQVWCKVHDTWDSGKTFRIEGTAGSWFVAHGQADPV